MPLTRSHSFRKKTSAKRLEEGDEIPVPTLSTAPTATRVIASISTVLTPGPVAIIAKNMGIPKTNVEN